MDELLSCDLALTAANGSTIPYEGCVELNFQVGESNSVLPVPFLIAHEIVELPLVGYNVIEHLIKSNELECDGISSSFISMGVSQAPALIEFINSVTRDELCPVKTRKSDVILPREQSVKISCRVNTGPLGKSTPVLFEADEHGQWPSGVEVADTLLMVKGGKSSRVDIEVRNTTRHDIKLRGRTVLGRLQLVQSVVPADVRLKDESENTQQPQNQHEPRDHRTTKNPDVPLIELPNHLKSVDLINGRKLMGFLNYYRRYIENFSGIAKPIYNLVKIPETDGKGKSTSTGKQLGGNNPVSWTSTHQSALETLVKCLVSAPVMAYPDPRSPYVLHTDASEGGLGAVLYQEQNGVFASYRLWITNFNTSREKLPSTLWQTGISRLEMGCL